MNFSKKALWSLWPRTIFFWLIFATILAAIDIWFSDVNFGLLWERVGLAIRLAGGRLNGATAETALAQLSQTDFIMSLAYGVLSSALAFVVSFGICHVLSVWLSLRGARKMLVRSVTLEEFRAAYDNKIYPALKAHPLIGHAWREFDETLVRPGPNDPQVLSNTVRPQSFVNSGLLREKLVGMKMMPSIPGYFVAIGLLLTFMGIVLALYKAGEASSAEDVSVMQHAMTELLQIASFKFATSIAGLGCSLLLSIVFKLYGVGIDRMFASFCNAAEEKLKYIAPQSLTHRIADVMEEQRDQLKDINSDKFFAQMGQNLGPQIQSAFATAMEPVHLSISDALDKVTQTSQSGIGDMIQNFTTGVQNGAGAEMREVAETLKALQVTMQDMQGGVRSSGEDFARRMSEAAENLNRLVSEAGQSMDAGAASNRDSLNSILTALQETFRQANDKVAQDLGNAASGASDKVESAMARVMDKLEAQVTRLADGMTAMDDNARKSVESTQKNVQEAQDAATRSITTAAQTTAEALQSGLNEVLQTMRNEIERFESALVTSRAALSSQASAIGDATSETRKVADVFATTAGELRTATAPLLQSSSQIREATRSFELSLKSAVDALQSGQTGSTELAGVLKANGERLVGMWDGYEQRFLRIDEELGRAVEKLASATVEQGEALSRYSREVDQGLAQAVQTLTSNTSDITGAIEEFSDEVSRLRGVQRPAAE